MGLLIENSDYKAKENIGKGDKEHTKEDELRTHRFWVKFIHTTD